MSLTPDSIYAEEPNRYNRYDVGVMIHPGPEDKRVRFMYYLVAYDICHPSRLRRVAKTCEAYGVRLEKSVFQCDLRPELFEQLWLELIDLIDEEEDAIVAYRICRSCLREVESMGVVSLPERPLCYIL